VIAIIASRIIGFNSQKFAHHDSRKIPQGVFFKLCWDSVIPRAVFLNVLKYAVGAK